MIYGLYRDAPPTPLFRIPVYERVAGYFTS